MFKRLHEVLEQAESYTRRLKVRGRETGPAFFTTGANEMNVAELIERLEDMDPEAEVLFISQPHWPFEYSIDGLVTRAEVEEVDNDRHDDEPGKREYRDGESANDVLLVEGRQLRYGSKSAWDAYS